MNPISAAVLLRLLEVSGLINLLIFNEKRHCLLARRSVKRPEQTSEITILLDLRNHENPKIFKEP